MGQPCNGHFYVKFPRGLVTTYNQGNGGIIDDIVTNSLVFAVFSDCASAQGSNLYYYNRVRFTDS